MRSLPASQPFYVAVFWSSLHLLGIVVTLTAFVCLILSPGETASRILIGGMGFSVVSWFIAFFKRRSARCPLCRGTPLINSGARTHVKTRRILPFNAGFTATLSTLATQSFRCMYCGSDFDLLKRPSHLRPSNQADGDDVHDSWS